MEHPVIPSGISSQAQKILAPDSPLPLKMMAAAGMTPLSPVDMVSVLYVFVHLPESALNEKARQTLSTLPDNILLGTLSSPLQAEVLDGIASLLISRSAAAERILLNPATADETICHLAETLQSEKLLELIIANENRLLRHPRIIEKLYFNRHTRMSSVDRAIELAIRNGIELTGIPAFDEIRRAIEGELLFEPGEDPTPDDLMFMDAMAFVDSEQENEQTVDEVNDFLDILSSETGFVEEGGDPEPSRQKVGGLQNALSKMTISQKIRTATLGNASQRSILVRDANKLVIMASLKSPAVNESEARRYSSLKSLPDEAIRYIATKRDWTKSYSVKLNLVNNPRTPVEYSLRFLLHLRANDIRTLERSKDIPGVIKKAAVELRKKRMS